MSREIKFEYLAETEEGKFHKRIFDLQDIEFGQAEDWLDEFYIATGDVMKRQYTGLKDCKGTEIYEGDILRHRFKFYGDPLPGKKELEVFEGTETGSIVFKNGCFTFVSANGKSEISGWIEPSKEDMVGMDRFDFEIIGNIYHHPEPLEKEAS